MNSEWEFLQYAFVKGKVYAVWTRVHREGYDAYAVTHGKTFPPQGTSHYTSAEALKRKTGIDIT